MARHIAHLTARESGKTHISESEGGVLCVVLLVGAVRERAGRFRVCVCVCVLRLLRVEVGVYSLAALDRQTARQRNAAQGYSACVRACVRCNGVALLRTDDAVHVFVRVPARYLTTRRVKRMERRAWSVGVPCCAFTFIFLFLSFFGAFGILIW
ncbi:hypothetical protein C8R43DRAFT_1017378 [Mycena crocata]|nr:hypothetical protein C8R43DRAFT_1017378 [Mycena crocata]